MMRSPKTANKWARALMAMLGVAVCASYVMASTPTEASNRIRDIQVSQKGAQTVVTIVGSERPMYTAFKLASPRRLVIDLANSNINGVPAVSDRKTALIDGVAVSEFTSGKVRVSRVMIGFKDEAAYRVKVDGNNLVVVLNGEPSAAKPSAKQDSEQEISLSSAARIAEIEKNASDEIARAKQDAGREVAMVKAEAEEARNLWRQASAELNKIKAQSAQLESEIQRTSAEREAANQALKEALRKEEQSREALLKGASQADKKVAEKIRSLSVQIERANAEAAQERARREGLEQRLGALQGDLDKAQREAETAKQAQAQAVKNADDMKAQMTEATLATSRARDKAQAANQAQREAQRAYAEASKGEQAKLRAELEERKREAAAAREELAASRQKQTALDGQLTQALNDLRASERKMNNADKRYAELDKQAARERARYQQQIAQMGEAVTQAEAQAKQADAARKVAEGKLSHLRVDADAKLQKERQTAEQAVAEARKNLQKAEQSKAAAEKAAANADAGLKQAKSAEEAARQRIDEVEKNLRLANNTIAQQQERIRELEQQGKAKETSAPAASANRKPTQEELRLQRLAEMKGGADAKPVAAKGKSTPKAAAAQKPASRISDIRFVNSSTGQKILIQTDGPVRYTKSGNEDRVLVLEFPTAALDPALERTLDVRDFGGAIEQISSFRQKDSVRVEVSLNGRTRTDVREKDGNIEWTFALHKPAAAPGLDKAGPKGNTTRVVHREAAGDYEYPQERTAAYSVKLNTFGKKGANYTGRRIDLDFKDADIHNILRLLSDVGQVNIITADDVKGSVTIRMRNVPWDQALDVILHTKGLGKVRDGNLIRVAPLSSLEQEFEREMERIAMSRALEPLETRLIPISYATAAELMPRAQDMLTERGKLSVDARTNVIIARDTANSLDQIEALIRNLDTQTPQVLIEGRIVEATSSYAREIGIQWGGDFSASAATGNPTGLAFPSSIGVAGGATDDQAPTAGLSPVSGAQPNPNYAVNLPAPAGTGSGGALGIALGSIANNANLSLRLSAMEEEGTLRILSSPKVLTLDNRKAYIEQGTMIPYSRVSASGVQTAFKEAKLNLTVTPHVTADGAVLMQINMTRDEPDFNNKGARGDPTILKREVSTELLVSDGHTAVIGGIFTRNHGQSFKKVPFFGDIPVLGWLFKSRSDSDRRTEMLIFITPTIVNRAESIGQ